MKLPSIDISSFFNPSATLEDQRRTAQAVDSAASELGFMQIVGHGIPENVLANLKKAMDDFFGQTLAAKSVWRPSDASVNRGYSGPLTEKLSYSMGVVSPPDLFEAFNMGSSAGMFPQLSLSTQDYPENIWPVSPANFQPAVQEWFEQAGFVARKMTRIFEVALDLPGNYFVPFQDHSLDVLRVNNYDISPEIAKQLSDANGQLQLGKDQQGMGAHTDYGIVTVLWADAVSPGIQVMDALGHWHEFIPEPDALLINLGDLMARWTNNRWLSSLHRVPPPVNSEGKPVRRRSAAYFHDGNADALIECLSSCCSQSHPPRYTPITVANHIRAKLAGSRTLQLNEGGLKDDDRISSYLS